MKTLFVLLITGALFSFSLQAQNQTVAGVTFPKTLKFGNETIDYNGAGLRTKYLFKLYVSALYLSEPSNNAQVVINQDKLSAVRLRILSSKVTRDRFVETVRDGFKTSTEGKASPSQIDDLMKLFNVEFKEGDDILLVYRSNSGISVYMNNKKLGEVGDLEFKKALFGIWLGGKPVDSTMKSHMLGL